MHGPLQINVAIFQKNWRLITLGRNITATLSKKNRNKKIGIDDCSGSECQTVTNRQIFWVGMSHFLVDIQYVHCETECHRSKIVNSRRFVKWTLRVGWNVTLLVSGRTDRQGTDSLFQYLLHYLYMKKSSYHSDSRAPPQSWPPSRGNLKRCLL